MIDPGVFVKPAPSQSTTGTPIPPGSAIGPYFQLALLAADKGNDQEAGDYMRKIIAAMKVMAAPGEADAGRGPNP